MNTGLLARNATLALGAILGGPFLTSNAHALPILSFGQVGNANTVVGARSGSSTTITATNAQVTISQIDGALATPINAFLNFSFGSTSAATTFGGSITENFSGTFSITSGTGGTGTDYLSGSLVDVAFGSNAAFNLNASTPPAGNVTFNSTVIAASDLGAERGAGFSFANVTPLLSIQSNTIDSFGSSVSGTFSANVGTPSPTPSPSPIPEPASMVILGMGLVGLGAIQRRAARKIA